MADAGQVSAFMDSGRRDGVLHYIYLFHALMSLPQIRPGDVVLDLACGPANQLLQIARLHPDCRFVGLDASPAMLQLAADNLRAAGVHNVSLQQGDMTVLAGVAAVRTWCCAPCRCITCLMSARCSKHCFRCGAFCARWRGVSGRFWPAQAPGHPALLCP
jgi:SAM-dependent methyltransferase